MRYTGDPVYVVDDDTSVREAVEGLVHSAGLNAKTFASAEEFLVSAHTEVPSCLVLDVELPGLSGLDLQQELAMSDVPIPIIFLSGHGDIPMSVRAMKAGALEFLTKPIDDQVLLGAIRKGIAHGQIRRAQRRDAWLPSAEIDSSHVKEFSPFRLDTVNQCLWRHRDRRADERILLTPKAFAVLRYLVDHAGWLVTHDELLDAVWPGTHIQPQAVKKLILDLRGALGDSAKKPLFIETLHRRGYRFIASVSGARGSAPCYSGPADSKQAVGKRARAG